MPLRWWCKVRQQRSQQLFSQCTPDSYRKRCRHEMHQYHSPLRVNQDRCLTRTSRTHRAVIRAAAYNVCKLCGASLEPARPSARGNVRLRGAGGAYTGRLAFVRSPVRMTPGVGLLTDHFSSFLGSSESADADGVRNAPPAKHFRQPSFSHAYGQRGRGSGVDVLARRKLSLSKSSLSASARGLSGAVMHQNRWLV